MTTDLSAQRRELPDQPGVYLFRDATDRVIYVGKAVSVRKRVASHFSKSNRGALGHDAMLAEIATIDSIVFATETEALLA